jgi:hypothetical protein
MAAAAATASTKKPKAGRGKSAGPPRMPREKPNSSGCGTAEPLSPPVNWGFLNELLDRDRGRDRDDGEMQAADPDGRNGHEHTDDGGDEGREERCDRERDAPRVTELGEGEAGDPRERHLGQRDLTDEAGEDDEGQADHGGCETGGQAEPPGGREELHGDGCARDEQDDQPGPERAGRRGRELLLESAPAGQALSVEGEHTDDHEEGKALLEAVLRQPRVLEGRLHQARLHDAEGDATDDDGGDGREATDEGCAECGHDEQGVRAGLEGRGRRDEDAERRTADARDGPLTAASRVGRRPRSTAPFSFWDAPREAMPVRV